MIVSDPSVNKMEQSGAKNAPSSSVKASICGCFWVTFASTLRSQELSPRRDHLAATSTPTEGSQKPHLRRERARERASRTGRADEAAGERACGGVEGR